jgi:hypothetical protein
VQFLRGPVTQQGLRLIEIDVRQLAMTKVKTRDHMVYFASLERCEGSAMLGGQMFVWL